MKKIFDVILLMTVLYYAFIADSVTIEEKENRRSVMNYNYICENIF